MRMRTEKQNVMRTREIGLCVSCEICLAVCVKGAITIEHRYGQFIPMVDENKCVKCGLCLEICPGIDIDPYGLRYEEISDSMFDGPYLESYTAYSKNLGIRQHSTSGGLITSLVIELIKKNEFDAAFVLPFDTFTGKPARLEAATEISRILGSAKSKYVPVSIYNVIVALTKRPDLRYIIVGTPCQILGIKKLLKKSKISEKTLLFLGLFCNATLNFNVIRYFEDMYRMPGEKLVKFDFRTKDKYGWPGNSKACFDSGRELIIDRSVRMRLVDYFSLKRCLFCTDKLNKMADISFGDCYIERKDDFYGKSSVIVRTQKGKTIFDEYSTLFDLKEENIEEIRRSQALLQRKDNLEYAKTIIMKHDIYPSSSSDYGIGNRMARRLPRLYQHLRWGQDYNARRIRFHIFITKVINKSRALRHRAKTVVLLLNAILEGYCVHRMSRRRLVTGGAPLKNIVIVGGSLLNKGAQAMTFTTIDQIRRISPDTNIYLFSNSDFQQISTTEKNIYRFEILPWQFESKLRILVSLARSLITIGNPESMESHMAKIIKGADLLIDLSGYALTSSETFSHMRDYSLSYLLNIMVAMKFSIPYYIFPQSIGPFDYRLMDKIILYPLMRLCLSYPKRIFIREEEGMKYVRKFTKKNVEKSYDIVLQSSDYDLSNIYDKEVYLRDITIGSNSVGIIPNLRVFERGDSNEIYSIYRSLIESLIYDNRNVYIVRHSYEDLSVCENIKSNFPANANVRLIADDLNCVELESIIKQFDFVVASRYHSIVHSYRNGIPALVIGWAAKYGELLKHFGQSDYLFDVRTRLDTDEIDCSLSKLIRGWKCEKERITNKMNALSQKNIFDILFG